MPMLLVEENLREVFRGQRFGEGESFTFVFTIEGERGDHLIDVVFTKVPRGIETLNPNTPESSKTLDVTRADLTDLNARFVIFLSRHGDFSNSILRVTIDGETFMLSDQFVGDGQYEGVNWAGPLDAIVLTLWMNS